MQFAVWHAHLEREITGKMPVPLQSEPLLGGRIKNAADKRLLLELLQQTQGVVAGDQR